MEQASDIATDAVGINRSMLLDMLADSRVSIVANTMVQELRDGDLIADLVEQQGLAALVVDFGILGEPTIPADVRREEVARAISTTWRPGGRDHLRRKAARTGDADHGRRPGGGGAAAVRPSGLPELTVGAGPER